MFGLSNVDKERYAEEPSSLLAERFPAGWRQHWETCEYVLLHAQTVLKYYCNPETGVLFNAPVHYGLV